MSVDEIRALPSVQQKFKEGKNQLLDYAKRLHDKYENKLQMMIVVAVWFERVVWGKMVNG